MKIKLVSLLPANDGRHKYMVKLLVVAKNARIRQIRFGSYGDDDYTTHYRAHGKEYADKMRNSYILRHQAREDWTNPLTAGFWSRWLLWEEPDILMAMRGILHRTPELSFLHDNNSSIVIG